MGLQGILVLDELLLGDSCPENKNSRRRKKNHKTGVILKLRETTLQSL